MSERHVVMFSGGVGSWAAAKRVAAQHGTDHLTLLFTDTLIEDEDTYRFLRAAAADVGGELVEIADGRTPWQVYRDRRFLGNARQANCSHTLKQDMARKWLDQHRDPSTTTIYLGIDWTERHRHTAAKRHWQPWRVESPLCERPFEPKSTHLDAVKAAGLPLPRLYTLGFPHANCGGGCVRAGQGQWARLLQVFPERFARWEQEEEAIRQHLGKDVAILRDRGGGASSPLTLRAFRERIEAGAQPDLFGGDGCGCFVDYES